MRVNPSLALLMHQFARMWQRNLRHLLISDTFYDVNGSTVAGYQCRNPSLLFHS